MAGFLDDYGIADARREKTVKRIVLVSVVLIVVAAVLYFVLRNFREERQVRRFIELLSQKNYLAAYGLWGCSNETPCRDYPIQEFMKDWGPESAYASVSSARVARTRSCSTGIIQTLDFGGGREVNLWVERKDQTIGFAPWPVCSPRMQAP